MSISLGQAALAISGILFASVWEGVIIVAAVWLFLRAFPKIDASTRYAIWLAALIMLVIAPLCTLGLSAPHEAHAASVTARAAGSQARVNTTLAAAPASAADVQTSQLAATRPATQRTHIDIPFALSVGVAVLWLLGAAMRLAVLLVNLRVIETLRRGAQTVRVAFGFPVLASHRTKVPLAIGFLRPAVLLPSSLNEELSAEAIDAIVMHEVAHLRRYDVWTNALARLLEAVLVLNPLAWVVLRRLSVEREIACDDWVVARLDAGEVFATTLAGLALRPAFTSIAAPSAIGSKHAVVARIERLLDRRPRRLRLSAAALTGMVLLFAIFATIVPTFSPVLAFAPHASTPKSAAGCLNHPALAELLDVRTGRPSGRWFPLKKMNDGERNDTVFDLTIDANGKLSAISVVSTPHARDAAAAKRVFAMGQYRPAIVNCKAVASKVRVAFLIDIAPNMPISIVRANYPSGWSSEHPGACRVPDLTHGGVPNVRLVNNTTLIASVLVHVDANGSVTGASLTRSSGNSAYDDATLAAARAGTYPLGDGFKPVRPSGAPLSWNATHGYSRYSKCSPAPTGYTWTTTFPPAD